MLCNIGIIWKFKIETIRGRVLDYVCNKEQEHNYCTELAHWSLECQKLGVKLRSLFCVQNFKPPIKLKMFCRLRHNLFLFIIM